MIYSRRNFVKFFAGSASVTVSASPFSFLNFFKKKDKPVIDSPFKEIQPSSKDDLVLAEGLQYEVLISWKDIINNTGDTFGFNNDYTAFLPIDNNRAYFWVNHEYPNAYFLYGFEGGEKSRKQINLERYSVGGSLLEVTRDGKGWRVDNSNGVRFNGFSKIPIISKREIQGSKIAIGTFSNCAGGVTPWGTFLSCEENVDDMYGDRDSKGNRTPGSFGWDKYFDYPPEHYGWVVEIDPVKKTAKKHTSIGRYSHECCTVISLPDGRVVAYSGDDRADEHIYKFVSSKRNSLEEGELFVANIEKGKWISLDINKQPILKANFKDQTDVLTYTREAAKLVGATPCDRPEDIEISPITGDVYICLTNNKKRNNFHGSILKISEAGGKHDANNFKSSDLIVGGDEAGFSCPDNICFDKNGNIWLTTDISGSAIGKAPYEKFKNNGLFYIPLTGLHAGKAFQVASAPVDSELTGVSFSSDYKTLFLSVQHPGERSSYLKKLTSHWPDGGDSEPKPSVVQISGPLLEKLVNG